MGSLSAEPGRVDSVCIIGAGPTGLACAKYLLAENAFSRIVIVEQRPASGGLWNYVQWSEDSKGLPVPQVTPDAGLDQPIWTCDGLRFMSPVYERLETNIPRDLMAFSDLAWSDDCQLFPKHEDVLAYVQEYARDVRHLITFSTQVIDIRRESGRGWFVMTQEITPDAATSPVRQHFDAVVVSNGHYIVPHIPSVSGIERWNEAYPDSITHSKFYRRPEHYAGKKVVLVGNAASGIDIGAQIMMFCQPPMLQSQRSESYLGSSSSTKKLEKPEIVEYITTDRSVRFADGSIESGIDCVVYCTGYYYSFPFLKTLSPPLITTGQRVENTYQHLFYHPDPSLALPGLNQKVIPFPLAEVQAAVIARVFSGRLQLPDEAAMKSWENEVVAEMGDRRSFHVLEFPKDANYINMLHDWAVSVDQSVEGKLMVGKTPPRWGAKQYWMRERFPAIKRAFQDFQEKRHAKRTLEDVGFDYAKWKAEQLEKENSDL